MPVLRIDDVAHGGEALGRLDGKVVFVAGAMPGELVEVEIVADEERWARAELRRVLEPAAARRDPPCRHFGACGGCDWQFADYEAQLDWKRRVVAGQLRHLGGLDVPVAATVPSPLPFGYRNRMDFSVRAGRPALLRRRSGKRVIVEECLLLQENLAELFERLGPLRGVHRVVLRGSPRTGERLVAVHGPVPPQAASWGTSVVAVGRRRVDPIHGRPWYHEVVAGVRFRVSATSFFQVNTAGADLLVELVDAACDVGPDDTLVDAYAGVGLFAATVGRRAGRVLAVEAARSSVADLRENAPDVEVVRGEVERALLRLGEPWDVVIADPPRSGLGVHGVEAVCEGRPRTIVYVSCDPAALARDAAMLVERGYELEGVTPLDLFPQTHHVESVARFLAR